MSLSLEVAVLFIADLADGSIVYSLRNPTVQKVFEIQKRTGLHEEQIPDHVETLDGIVRYLYEQGYGIDRST